MKGLLLVVLVWALCSSLAPWPGGVIDTAEPMRVDLERLAAAARRALVTPVLLGIRDVESSRCTDQREGRDRERTCYQIKPETARVARCVEGWDAEPDGILTRDCARRVMAWKQAQCRRLGYSRWDAYAQAFAWNRGKCMYWRDRPTGYEMDAARARLRHL